MRKEEFFFDSRDGISRLHAVRYLPDSGEVAGVVQIVHGMAEYIERYEEFAAFLTKRGFAVTGEDHLGHGKSVPEGGLYGYFCERDPATVVVRDVHRLKKMTQERFPSVPYVFVGHSMGSFILRNYLCRYGSGISGAVIVGTGMQRKSTVRLARAVAAAQGLFCGGKHVSRLIDKASFGAYNQRVEKPRTPVDWLSRNEENVDRYLADPMCGFVFTVNGFRTLFELISRIQDPENLGKVPKDLPLFLLSGAEDPVGEYGAGVDRAYRSLRDAGVKRIRVKMYDGDRHELLNETDREQVFEDILGWIGEEVLAPSWNGHGGTEAVSGHE